MKAILVLILTSLVAWGCAKPAPSPRPPAPVPPPPSAAPARSAPVDANRALADALARRDAQGVRQALATGAQANASLEHGLSPLMVAAGLADVHSVKALLEAGADVHRLEPRMGASALHKAAQGGDPEVARLLLDAGAFVNLQAPTHGHTALMDAVWHQRPRMVAFLLERGANADIVASDGSTARFWAERAKLADILAILDRFAAARQKRVASLALLRAAKDGDVAEVEALLAQGADPNQVEPDRGYTPLHWACLRGHTEVVRVLLARGGDVRHLGALMKATVAHKAAYMGHAPALVLVLERGVELDAQGPYNGYTALHDAVWHGHIEAAKVLIDAGARLDLRGHDGATPLELAKRCGYDAIVKLLEQAMATKQ